MADFRRRSGGNDWTPGRSSAAKRSRAMTGVNIDTFDTRPVERERLAHTIETEILPRLLMANKRNPARSGKHPSTQGWQPSAIHVAELTRRILLPTPADATDYVAGLRRSGLSQESICLDLFAPVARQLGEAWEADTCTFVDVTIGLSRLQRLLDDATDDTEPIVDAGARRIVVVGARGEQHTFGPAILQDVFRRATWEIVVSDEPDFDATVELVRKEHVDVIAISISQDLLLDQLGRDIAELREIARNRRVVIIVGGPAINRRPERAVLVGSNGTAEDARKAVQLATSLTGRDAKVWS